MPQCSQRQTQSLINFVLDLFSKVLLRLYSNLVSYANF